MHFEVLIEDQSGKIAIEYILKRIFSNNNLSHTFKIFSYKGIGRTPKGLKNTSDPSKRILLDQLPRILKGYGKSFHNTPDCAVLVVVDSDKRNCVEFKNELLSILDKCNPRPTTLFRIAIEEIEAWYLGDIEAIKKAYKKAKHDVLDSYIQDSICNTWEKLADAIYPGGSSKLRKLSFVEVGNVKCEWAEKISPFLDIETNRSKSFQVFRDGVLRLAKK
jgi:hypothetical protein